MKRDNFKKLLLILPVVFVVLVFCSPYISESEKEEIALDVIPSGEPEITFIYPAVVPSVLEENTPEPEKTPEPFIKSVPEVLPYGEGVHKGSVRYVSQLNDVEKNGWGKYAWKAGMECTTACISMALSYLGIDESPEALLDFSSRTYLASSFGIEEIDCSSLSSPVYEEDGAVKAFFAMFEDYLSDEEGNISPIVVYISGNGNHHAFLAVGKDGDDILVADPTPFGVHRVNISDEGEITTNEDEYLTRYITESCGPALIQSLGQWHFK